MVLSDRLWRERFGVDPAVLGRAVNLGGVGGEIVGVMPPAFAFPSADSAFWIPRVVPATGIGGWTERAVARLATGAEAAALEREILSLYLTRLMEAMLPGVTATDPVSVTLLTALLVAVAGIALWLAARRASRIDPLVALRTG